MSTQQPFMPKYGIGFAVSPAAASANSAIESSNNQVRVTNTGAAIGFFRTYSSGTATGDATATDKDMAVPAGLSTIVTKSLGHDRIAYISPAGTTFQIMTGEGY